MKKIFVLIVFVVVISSLIELGDCKKGSLEKEWKLFKAEFNKTYVSNTEEQKRYKIFKENLHNIQKHNSRYENGKETYLQEINSVVFSPGLCSQSFWTDSIYLVLMRHKYAESGLQVILSLLITNQNDWFCIAYIPTPFNLEVLFIVCEAYSPRSRCCFLVNGLPFGKFGDLTDKEFSDIYGLSDVKEEALVRYPEEPMRNQSFSTNVTNEHLDWREAGAVTPAKDQGKCGSCWIFSAVSAMESYHFRQTGKLLSLSEQSVVDCFSNDTCDGGVPYAAVDFVQNHGIYLESDYPYTAEQDPCRNITKTPINIDFNSSYYVYGSDDDIKEGVKEHGPLSICLYVTAKWRFYSSGVWYHNKCSASSNHCVLIVGYGTENGNDYWLMKNSWGSNWGHEGYIKVARNKHPNYCGITYGLYLVANQEIEENSEENEI